MAEMERAFTVIIKIEVYDSFHEIEVGSASMHDQPWFHSNFSTFSFKTSYRILFLKSSLLPQFLW